MSEGIEYAMTILACTVARFETSRNGLIAFTPDLLFALALFEANLDRCRSDLSHLVLS